MKKLGLSARIRIKKTNNMYHRNRQSVIAPNILNRNFLAAGPGEKYVTDITYIPFRNGMAYLSVMLDLFNGEVVSYKVSKSADSSLSVDVVKALQGKRRLTGSLIHSDQGIHYTNKEYTSLLQENGAVQSMSRKGNCWDNAVIENFFGHFKCECIKIRKRSLRSFANVVEVVEDYMRFYNTERLQKKLGEMSPLAYREHFSNSA